MTTRLSRPIIFILCVLLFSTSSALASKKSADPSGDTAIIIASFGTSVPSAVTAISNIYQKTKKAFPTIEVRICFTSNIIRSIWRERREKPREWLDQGILREILYVKNIISTIGDLCEEGYRNIIVQPTHMFYMEQSQDLKSYVDALASIRTTKKKWNPFDKLVMGRPALGMPGNHYDYHKDLAKAVQTLAGDAQLARENNAMLIYMGHGNEHWSTGIYAETQKKMRTEYPDVQTFVGVAEGMPGINDFLSYLPHAKTKKIILKPFMIVAGDHAKNDMAGSGPNSWKSILTQEGYEVQSVLEGLGSNDNFAALFVDHIKDTAREHNIQLQ